MPPVVAVDHGAGLRRLGVGRRRFAADVMASAAEVTEAVLTPPTGRLVRRRVTTGA
ncbi:hypothetical protein ACH4D3_35595 [Streptomyces sp. NPDC018026]|uniref:hypothetical protein n=1 Tax=Streptomyces sp. NPDC018026 TaxID=3365031 RepID=UPI0037B52294